MRDRGGTDAGQRKDGAVSILAVDVGNTVTRYGLFEDDRLLATWDIATRDSLTADEARLSLHGFLDVWCGDNAAMESDGDLAGAMAEEAMASVLDRRFLNDGIISCVVPNLLGVYTDALQAEFDRPPLTVGPGLKTGMRMRYNDPAEIGPDRIADMVAAKASYDLPLAIVDLGTATNIAVLDAEGVYLGGLIAPGLALSARALSHAAARLPTIEITSPSTVIGKNNREAMQAGFVFGETARIDGLLEMIWDELGQEGEVVITGTDAGAVAEMLAREVQVDDTLTLRGLNLLYGLNRRRD
jgi:type III pantothenate kinase